MKGQKSVVFLPLLSNPGSGRAASFGAREGQALLLAPGEHWLNSCLLGRVGDLVCSRFHVSWKAVGSRLAGPRVGKKEPARSFPGS